MGKGSKKRPSMVSREQEELNWKLAMKQITFKKYEQEREKLIEQGLWGPTEKLRY